MKPRRKTLFGPTVVFPAVSAGLLVAIFLVYYFPVTARQEESINERALRTLAAMSDQLRNRVVSYATVLGQVSRDGLWVPPPGGSGRSTAIESAVDRLLGYMAVQVPDLEISLRREEPLWPPCDSQVHPTTVSVERGNDQSVVAFRCGEWRATIPVERLVASHLDTIPEGMFEELVVADDTGAVIYQSRMGSLRMTALPEVAERIGAEEAESDAGELTLAESSTTSDIVRVYLGGSKFRAFVVPVPLALSRTDAGVAESSPDPDRLILLGLVSEAEFRAESMAVPENLAVGLVLLFLAAIVATWPIVKFRAMRATERMPRRTVQYFWLSMLGTIAMLFVFGVHAVYVFDVESVDANLSSLADAVEDNLEQEVRQALTALNDMRQSPVLLGESPADAAPETPPEVCRAIGTGFSPPLHSVATPTVIPSTLTNALAISGARVEAYPYFDLVFWSDNEGWQHIKWDTSSRATLQARANDRAYYRETREQDLWRFPNSDRFRVDTIFSRNTGEYLAVISRPAPRFDICPGRFLAVESMITPLLSLVRPVVPPDYGFAVIDTAGSVLFHSTATKNGQENFFAELADDNSARGAVLGKRNQHFFARYNGVEHRFYATPFERLENAPWALVAFHDLSARSAQNFERTVLFSALVVAYCALVAFIILAIPFGTRAPVWIWPQAQAHATYIKLVITLALLGVAFYLLADDVVSIFDGGFYRLLAAGVLLPFLSIGVVMCALESRMRGSAIFLIAAVSVLAVWPQEGLARQHWAFFPVVVGLLALRFRPMGEARSVLVSGGVLIAIGATWRYGHALPLSILALAALPFLPPIGPWIERWARSPMRKSANPRSGEETAFVASYTAVWVLTLMLSGVVANVAFFKVAYDLHEYISRRLVQVETINSLIDREDRVRRRYSAVSLSGPGSGVEENETYRWLFIRRRLEQTLDRYDTAFMGSTILDPAFSWGANSGSRSGVDRTSDGPPSPFESHRDMWYAPHELPQGLVRIASYVPFGLGPVGRQLGVVSFSGRGRSESDSAYSWTVVRNRIRISRSGEGELGRSPATMALRKAVENDPTFISSELVSGLALFVPWDIGVSLIVFAAGCGLAFVWIKRTLESIFVTRVPKEDPIPELSFDECTGLVGNNILLVEEFGRMDAALAERDDVRIIDFADVRRGGSADERAAGGTSIVVNGLDLEDRDPEADIRALELIELLRRRFPSANVLIVATINPVFLFEQGGELGGGASREDPTLRDRWARALSGFSVYRAVARTDLPPSMRHRLAWSACATTERVALYQLAREGWANPRNLAAYQHLFRRGVLGPAPYDFVDEEFRRFVRDSVGKAELKSWEREETASLWDGIRMMFVVLAIGLVVTLLFLNQQSVLGLVVSAGGALTAFLKLFTEARGLRSFLGLGGGGETA